MARKKGDVAVKNLKEVQDLAQSVADLQKGFKAVKSGWESIISTVEQINKAQRESLKWGEKATKQAKQQAEAAKIALGFGTKSWWHTKGIVKFTDTINTARLRRLKIQRAESGIEDEITDKLIDQIEANQENLDIGRKLNSVLDTMDSAFGGMGATIKGFLFNPLTAVVALLVTFTKMQQNIGDNYGAMGMRRFQDDLMDINQRAVQLGYNFEDVATSTNTLASDFGVAFDKALGMSESVMSIARSTSTGVNGAATLMGMFTEISGHSASSAESLLLSAEQLAVANDVAPGEILDNISESTETFAGFAKDGGENILRAAIQAKKLGTNLDTVGGIAKGLLNFQDSLNKEVEASVLLGKNLNFQKARELALNNDLEGMMSSILDQVGGEAEWNELNLIQRQALADALGVDLMTMSKLVSKEKEAATLQGKMAEFESKNPIPEEALTATAELLNNLKALGMSFAQDFGKPLTEIVTTLMSFIQSVENSVGWINILKYAMIAWAVRAGFAVGQTLALIAVKLGLFVSEAAVATAGIAIPIATAAAAGIWMWTKANMLQSRTALAEGGIVTRPTNALIGEAGPEAVIPLDSNFKKGNSQGLAQLNDAINDLRDDMRRYFDYGGIANKEIARNVSNAAIATR